MLFSVSSGIKVGALSDGIKQLKKEKTAYASDEKLPGSLKKENCNLR